MILSIIILFFASFTLLCLTASAGVLIGRHYETVVPEMKQSTSREFQFVMILWFSTFFVLLLTLGGTL